MGARRMRFRGWSRNATFQSPDRIGLRRAGSTFQFCEKWPAGLLKLFLQSLRAITVRAGPGLGAILVAAIPASMRVLDAEQVEVFLPIRTLLLQRDRTKTGFHPMGRSIRRRASLLHIVKVFVTRDGTAPERPIGNRLDQRLLLAGFDFGFHEVTNAGNIPRLRKDADLEEVC